MASVNRVILVGHLGQDPEIRRTQDGRPIAHLNLATSESWRDKQTGERKQMTDWHDIVVFNERSAKFAEQYLKKGAKVYVEGQLKKRQWTDNAGNKRYAVEVVINAFNGDLKSLESVGSGYEKATEESYGYQGRGRSSSIADSYEGPTNPRGGQTTTQFDQREFDDEIPF